MPILEVLYVLLQLGWSLLAATCSTLPFSLPTHLQSVPREITACGLLGPTLRALHSCPLNFNNAEENLVPTGGIVRQLVEVALSLE